MKNDRYLAQVAIKIDRVIYTLPSTSTHADVRCLMHELSPEALPDQGDLGFCDQHGNFLTALEAAQLMAPSSTLSVSQIMQPLEAL